jgi:hypothetical protein
VPKISAGEKATVINGRWFQDKSTLKCTKAKKAPPKFEISQLMSSLDSHGLGFTTRRMSSLKACANIFKHRKSEVTCPNFETR